MNNPTLKPAHNDSTAAKFEPSKILTWHWAKPIPITRFDWSATFDGYEPGDPIGYGATESEAITDLLSE